MNLGNIPGYYWDEEKKKYFLITADHAVESRQKYTKSNVRHEKQVAKRRKLEQRHEKKRQAQTIKRSRLLSIPEYAGVGLHREIGGRSSALDGVHADDAFISQLQYQDIFVSGLAMPIVSAHTCPSINSTILTRTDPAGSYIYTISGNTSHSSATQWSDKKERDRANGHSYASFSGLALSTSVWPAHEPQRLLACGSGSNSNLVISSVATPDSAPEPGYAFLIGNDETTLWDSAISSAGDTAAIAGSDRVIHLSMDGLILDTLPGVGNSRSLSWLTPTTVAASSGKTALLWDTRARGSSSRFSCQHTITGVRSVPSSSGTQLLLSTNFGLSLHDTRMQSAPSSRHSKPLLHFPIVHEEPQLVFDVSARDLVAVSQKNGRRDEVRILSLRTGREVRTLQLPPEERKRPTQLVWRQDERGVEFLQACIGERIGKWCWKDEE
ncbi:hypothetical protein Q7P36_009563 [Cladosporium allicinum]